MHIIVAISILTLLAISIIPSLATAITEDATRRADMIAIADRYVNYSWQASTDNALHESNVDTPNIGWYTEPIY